MIFFLLLSLLCFADYVFCSKQLDKYKNGISPKNVRLLSFYKSESIAKGSSLRKNKIQWYNLNIELPPDSIPEPMETTISTTNARAKKYRNREYIDVYVVYKAHSDLIDGVYIKEDLKKPFEKFASLVLGAVFMGIFLVCLYLTLV